MKGCVKGQCSCYISNTETKCLLGRDSNEGNFGPVIVGAQLATGTMQLLAHTHTHSRMGRRIRKKVKPCGLR